MPVKSQTKNNVNNNRLVTTHLGAQVDNSIAWKFKEIAARRKENMQEAMKNAALLYIDAEQSRKEEA